VTPDGSTSPAQVDVWFARVADVVGYLVGYALSMGTSSRKFAFVVIGVAGLFVGACGGSDEDSTTAADDATAVVGDPTVVIDVRTPDEFAAGHLEGAVNIDLQAPDFEARIGELDPAGSYVVYCRSGNRSGIAVDRMIELGISDAVNVGSLQSAAEFTSLDIVT
jgi:phage shock protein E